MRPELLSRIFAQVEPPPRLNVWQWAEQNVDFARSQSYPTEYKGRYDPEFLPFWKEPAENITNPKIREQAILKCSQAGGTENVCLNAIRHAVAVQPRRILYVWGDQKAAEEDFRVRIVDGLRCSKATERKLATARTIEARLDLPDMTIAAAWPKNRMAFKRNPWSLIIADEFSTYSDMTPGMIRKRVDTVAFSHIVWLSSPDPTMKRGSQDDPIFIEFLAGDRREWMMPDPKTGRLFKFEMGAEDTVHGLKWEGRQTDGTWDVQKVGKTAHYITPDGTRIDNDARMHIVREGRWVAHNLHAPDDRRSYHINAFCMPFKSGDFGAIAAAFLQANYRGASALKVFIYEYLAEPFYETKEAAVEDQVEKRVLEYAKKTRPSELEPFKAVYFAKQKAVIVTVDVQKDYFWWVVREWIMGGNSGLMDWGHAVTFDDLLAVVEQYKADYMGIDFGFALREYEVLQFALQENAKGSKWVIPLKGQDNMNTTLLYSVRDPWLGKTRSGKAGVEVYQWHPDTFRTQLMQMIRGESREQWYVYRGVERDYAKQVCALEKVDGVWQNRKGYTQDHLGDCEFMSVVMARILGYFQNAFTERSPTDGSGEAKAEERRDIPVDAVQQEQTC